MASPAQKLPIETERAGGNVVELTVSELSGAIKRALEDGFGHVRLKGEISGYRGPHSSGHCYFALKDDKAKIDAVVWKGVFSRLRFRPEEGMEVIATGKVTTYPGSSKYQIMIEAMEPAGVGALMALLEERKRKLAAEGLFEETRKRPLPFLPRVVGIVTSPTGAVIRDMLHGFDERFPTRVIVWPVRVQGEGSAAEVAAAIRGFNALPEGGRIPRPDVLIVARGGGSLEDLWGFNDESVVRAVAESRIPLISAVGHETDWTLIDLVADARAPTPTKAAEWAVPKFSDLAEQSEGLARRLKVGIRRTIEGARTHLKAAARGLPRADDLVQLPRQRLDTAGGRLASALAAQVQRRRTRLATAAGRLPAPRSLVDLPRQRLDAVSRRLGHALLANARSHAMRLARAGTRLQPRLLGARLEQARERLDVRIARARTAFVTRIERRRAKLVATSGLLASLSYQSVLRRGYAVVRDEAGRAVRLAAAVTPGMRLDIEIADGRIDAEAIAPGRARGGAGSTGAAGSEAVRGPSGTSPPRASPRPLARPEEIRPRREREPGSGGGQGSLF